MDISKVTRDGLKDVIGQRMDDSTLSAVKRSVENSVEGMVGAGVLTSGAVQDVRTLHARKGFFGRAKDFLFWRTFLKRWYYKPFYERVGLVEKLLVLREHTSVFEGMSDEVFEDLLQTIHAITIWEERYPDDPYSIVVVNALVTPVIPVEHINVSVTLEEE